MLSFSLTLEPMSKPALAMASMSFRLSCALRRIIRLHSKNYSLLAAPYKVPPMAVAKSLRLLRDEDFFSISETVTENFYCILNFTKKYWRQKSAKKSPVLTLSAIKTRDYFLCNIKL